jgi:hypothetical protein
MRGLRVRRRMARMNWAEATLAVERELYHESLGMALIH